ncbi:MAG: hypothetical protein J7J19_03325 [Thaumarchaeota archaeon]|nr:hypothetical protein [Nitrososphaerota archaeon]
MRKESYYLMIIILVSIFLRIYPTMISGLPFSTDSWPLIRNAERLVENSPIPLNSKLFDGYNNYWPLSQIYGAILSMILNISPMNAMRIYIPFLASLTPLTLYLLLRRLTRNETISFFASILFAAGGPHAIFTAGVTKETFANLIFIQSIYSFSILCSHDHGLLEFILLVIALTMSHHMAYIVCVVIFMSIFFAELFLPRLRGNSMRKRIIMLMAAILIGAIYYLVYALPGLKMTLSLSDWLSAFSFQVLTFMVMFYIVVRPKPRRIPNLWIAFILIASIALLVNQVTPIVPASPHLTSTALFYAYVLIFLGFFAVIGLYAVKDWGVDDDIHPILFWISAILGLEGYAIFGANPDLSLTLAYRLPNLIIPALATLAGAGLLRISLMNRSKFYRILSATCLIFFTVALASQSYSAVILQENYLGYQWLYLPQEYQQAIWIKRYSMDCVIYGDLKVKYLLGEYLGLKVDPIGGYRLLRGEGHGSKNLFSAYMAMSRNGYLLGPYGIELPSDWSKRLYMHDILFSNQYTTVYQL